MPEWHLITAILAGITVLSSVWSPLRFALPLLALGVLVPVAQAVVSATRASFPDTTRATRLWRRLLTGLLHLVQPIARLRGRLKEGLTPWRCHGSVRPAPLWPVTTALWSEQWRAPGARLHQVEGALRGAGACVLQGGPHDRWDLEVRGGFLGAARLLMAVEEFGGGRQLVRLRSWPTIPARGPILTIALAALAAAALHDHAWVAGALIGFGAMVPLAKGLEEGVAAMATVRCALRLLRDGDTRERP
ncbi:MAG: hypothetical protein AUI36_28620 [Cyanobacteria bacterium 13_1_40CM_2_61_4]|nr:MAG: hypothetical protein AUI36_28620 [Cyanobacteria bacterium 13_1_40CM_2_61_4]